MKTVLGICIITVGVALGSYLGVWIMFIGGIVQIINSLPHQVLGSYVPVDAVGIALGILRILCSGLVGWLSGIVVIGFGVALL